MADRDGSNVTLLSGGVGGSKVTVLSGSVGGGKVLTIGTVGVAKLDIGIEVEVGVDVDRSPTKTFVISDLKTSKDKSAKIIRNREKDMKIHRLAP